MVSKNITDLAGSQVLAKDNIKFTTTLGSDSVFSELSS